MDVLTSASLSASQWAARLCEPSGHFEKWCTVACGPITALRYTVCLDLCFLPLCLRANSFYYVNFSAHDHSYCRGIYIKVQCVQSPTGLHFLPCILSISTFITLCYLYIMQRSHKQKTGKYELELSHKLIAKYAKLNMQN